MPCQRQQACRHRRVPRPDRSVTCKAGSVEHERDLVQRISAVTLLTADMAAAVSFYLALGFRLLYGGPVAGFTSFGVGGGFLNLQAGSANSGPTAIWGRVVFWVDDVDDMYERALKAGLVPETSPADAPWGERFFHIRDPDGHELSFARPLVG